MDTDERIIVKEGDIVVGRAFLPRPTYTIYLILEEDTHNHFDNTLLIHSENKSVIPTSITNRGWNRTYKRHVRGNIKTLKGYYFLLLHFPEALRYVKKNASWKKDIPH
jgi:hypothetical protein